MHLLLAAPRVSWASFVSRGLGFRLTLLVEFSFVNQIASLAESKMFDYLIVESTGVSEPQQVAESFALEFAEMHMQSADDVRAEAERIKAEARAKRLEKDGKGGDEGSDEVSSALRRV